MPEMFYGRNRLYIYSFVDKVCVSFTPFEAVSQCVESMRSKCFTDGVSPTKIDQIDLIP